MCTYIGNVSLKVHDSRHLLLDLGFVDDQATVRADQLSQVNHELPVGPAGLSSTDTFEMFVSLLYFNRTERMMQV